VLRWKDGIRFSLQKQGQTLCTGFIGLRMRATFLVLQDTVMKFQVS
jgi:hypothetical protein